MLQIFNGNSSQINTTIPGNIDAAYLQTLHRACIVILPAEDKFTLLVRSSSSLVSVHFHWVSCATVWPCQECYNHVLITNILSRSLINNWTQLYFQSTEWYHQSGGIPLYVKEFSSAYFSCSELSSHVEAESAAFRIRAILVLIIHFLDYLSQTP